MEEENKENGSALNRTQIDFAKTLIKENHPLNNARLAQIFPKMACCLPGPKENLALSDGLQEER